MAERDALMQTTYRDSAKLLQKHPSYPLNAKLAKDIEIAYDENDMVGADAIKVRRKYPTLQKAWDRYKTIWHLINV